MESRDEHATNNQINGTRQRIRENLEASPPSVPATSNQNPPRESVKQQPQGVITPREPTSFGDDQILKRPREFPPDLEEALALTTEKAQAYEVNIDSQTNSRIGRLGENSSAVPQPVRQPL